MITATDTIPPLSLRHLKAMLYVAQYKNLSRAAKALNRSQTAITKAIADLESQLDVTLFNRGANGMSPTIYGDALAKRVEQMATEFDSAGKAYLAYQHKHKHYKNIAVFSMDISYKRLASFIAVFECKDIAAAANLLRITRTTVYNAVRQLEELLELPLFERGPDGMSCSAFCIVLARHVKLAFAQIRHAIDDIASINGVTLGCVSIGTLPYTRTLLTPRAIIHLLDQYPQLDVLTTEGPYSVLEASLRSGDLDFIVGAIRDTNNSKDIVTEKLFEDRLSVITRKGHPLELKKHLTLFDLQNYDWILPSKNTPARQLFDQVLKHAGIAPPEHAVQTSSLSTTRSLLLESNRVALLSEHQIYYDKKCGMLTALDIELKQTYRPIGVTMRARTQPSPAARLFLNTLREVAERLSRKDTQAN